MTDGGRAGFYLWGQQEEERGSVWGVGNRIGLLTVAMALVLEAKTGTRNAVVRPGSKVPLLLCGVWRRQKELDEAVPKCICGAAGAVLW